MHFNSEKKCVKQKSQERMRCIFEIVHVTLMWLTTNEDGLVRPQTHARACVFGEEAL